MSGLDDHLLDGIPPEAAEALGNRMMSTALDVLLRELEHLEGRIRVSANLNKDATTGSVTTGLESAATMLLLRRRELEELRGVPPGEFYPDRHEQALLNRRKAEASEFHPDPRNLHIVRIPMVWLTEICEEIRTNWAHGFGFGTKTFTTKGGNTLVVTKAPDVECLDFTENPED